MDKKRFGECFVNLWNLNLPGRNLQPETIKSYWEVLSKYENLEKMFRSALETDWNNKFPSYHDLKRICLSLRKRDYYEKQHDDHKKEIKEKNKKTKEEKEALEKSRNEFVFICDFLRLFRCNIEWIMDKVKCGELEVPPKYKALDRKSPNFIKDMNKFGKKYKEIIKKCPKVNNNLFSSGEPW